MNTSFETQIHQELFDFLRLQDEIDERFPEAIDIEEKWLVVGQSYLPDGMREFRDYPLVSFGWMMYLGMAVTQYWEDDWEIYGQMPDLYIYIRDKEGFDTMDEYVRGKVLHLDGDAFETTETMVQSCAQRAYSALSHAHIESGTKEAFEAYVACLHQLYLMGMAVQLHRLGYKMQPM